MASSATFSLSPAQACVEIVASENDCVCQTELEVTNTCAEPLTAIGYAWCRYPDRGCTSVIAPGETNYLYLPREGATTLGPHTLTLEMELGSAPVTLTIGYEVVHVKLGGCAAAGGGSAAAIPAVLLGLVLVRRRRARR